MGYLEGTLGTLCVLVAFYLGNKVGKESVKSVEETPEDPQDYNQSVPHPEYGVWYERK